MLINKKVKIYVVVLEVNTNSSNLYHKGIHNNMIVIKQSVFKGGGGGVKPFVNNQSSSNVVKLLNLKWARRFIKLCVPIYIV
jgi:hypothetical protein